MPLIFVLTRQPRLRISGGAVGEIDLIEHAYRPARSRRRFSEAGNL